MRSGRSRLPDSSSRVRSRTLKFGSGVIGRRTVRCWSVEVLLGSDVVQVTLFAQVMPMVCDAGRGKAFFTLRLGTNSLKSELAKRGCWNPDTLQKLWFAIQGHLDARMKGLGVALPDYRSALELTDIHLIDIPDTQTVAAVPSLSSAASLADEVADIRRVVIDIQNLLVVRTQETGVVRPAAGHLTPNPETGIPNDTADTPIQSSSAGATTNTEATRPTPRCGTSPAGTEKTKPRWVKKVRRLYLGDMLVKRFRRHAANQEALLDAFEEQGWSLHIDDPLPPKNELDPKERLREAVRALNENHRVQGVLKFEMDGTGEGVVYLVIEAVDGP